MNEKKSSFVMPQIDAQESTNRAQPKGDDYFTKVVSITEAARINHVTRQAIYVAIKQQKLRARKHMARWVIHLDDLEDYRNQKYSRTKSTFNGELLFDNNRGYYSINQTARMLNIPAQKVYYATRVGHLKAQRRGAAWVIYIDDIKSYRESYLTRRRSLTAQAS
jgi:predicted DNA-binding protein YlxM (UPF0122 family)